MSLARLREKLNQLSAKQNDADSFTFDIAGQDTIQGIIGRGNRPDDWLEYTQLLRKEMPFPSSMSRHNFMCDLYDKALTEINPGEHRNNDAFARLYLSYARLKSEYIMDDAQSLYSTARVYGRKLAEVYIASAQFEMDNGNKSKARKILEKGLLFEAKPCEDLEEALQKLKSGNNEIYVSPVAVNPNLNLQAKKDTTMDMVEQDIHTPEQRNDDVKSNAQLPAINEDVSAVHDVQPRLPTMSFKPIPHPAPISVPSKFGLRKFHSTPLLNSEQKHIRTSDVGPPMRVKKLNLPMSKLPMDDPLDDADTMDSFKPLETHGNGTTFGNHAHTSGYLSMTADSTIPMETNHLQADKKLSAFDEVGEKPEVIPSKTYHESHVPNVALTVGQPPSMDEPILCTPSMKGVIPPTTRIPNTPMSNMTMITVNSQQYGILGVLGKGGSSEVYQVLDSQFRVKAVKCVNLNNANELIVEGYKNEIKLLKRLQYCDKVIKMYDFEYVEEEEKLYVVMEAGSEDLACFFRSRIKDKKMLSDNLTRFYWEIMLEAVHALHREGIIHSDLKPANFLLVGGNLKLIDFGIAKALQQDKTSVVLETQIGTLNYMSPEAIIDSCGDTTTEQGKPKYKISVKSDVWSLGCILYNMVYGRTPFQHLKANFFKLQAIINPEFPIEFPDIPNKPLIDVMQKCLCRVPKSRPSIDDLLAHPYLTLEEEAKAKEGVGKLRNKNMEALVSNLATHYSLSPRGLRSLIHQTIAADQVSPDASTSAAMLKNVIGAGSKVTENKAPIQNPLRPHLLNRPHGPVTVKHMRTPLQSVNLQSIGSSAAGLGQPHNRHKHESGS